MTPLDRYAWARIERLERAELAVLADLRTERHPTARRLAARMRRTLVRALDVDLRALGVIDLGGEA